MNECETLTDVEQDETADRRVSKRVPFSAALGVCEMAGDEIPPASDFRRVKGFNLSHTGISFATTEWPENERLVVMLGNPDQPVFVVTRIVGCVRRKQRTGSLPFKVCCEFEKWVR